MVVRSQERCSLDCVTVVAVESAIAAVGVVGVGTTKVTRPMSTVSIHRCTGS